MEGMTIQDLSAMRELTKDKHSGKWSENTALWAIVIVLLVLAAMWYVNRVGSDKADLAAAVQSATSRINSLEVATAAQGGDIKSLNSVLSATTQAVGDFKSCTSDMLAALNGAVFAPRTGGCSRGCNGGNGSARFVKTATYCLNDSQLQEIDTCG